VTVDQAVGARIRAAREGAGLTQEDLARALGVTPGQVSHMELGRRAVMLHQLPAIARALGVGPADLLPSSWSW
jgi:transcriptional regulator with XRE-family HTH domain